MFASYIQPKHEGHHQVGRSLPQLISQIHGNWNELPTLHDDHMPVVMKKNQSDKCKKTIGSA